MILKVSSDQRYSVDSVGKSCLLYPLTGQNFCVRKRISQDLYEETCWLQLKMPGECSGENDLISSQCQTGVCIPQCLGVVLILTSVLSSFSFGGISCLCMWLGSTVLMI